MARVTVQPSAPTSLGSGGVRVRSAASADRREGWLRRLPVLPALIYVILITQLPFVLTIFYSLQSWNLLSLAPARFIGLQNYLDILKDPSIRTAIWNTIVLTVCAVAISVALGVGIAVLLNREIFGKGILRTLMIGPFLVMPTAAALMWKDTLLNPLTGFVNYVLTPIGLGTFDFINRRTRKSWRPRRATAPAPCKCSATSRCPRSVLLSSSERCWGRCSSLRASTPSS